MSGPKIRARPDQVAELTRGIQLPLTPLNEIHISIIIEMLEQAWNDLLQANPQLLKNSEETEITTLMEARLNASLDNNQLFSNIVRIVSRGKETISFDGSHLEKRPDLSIYLTAQNRNFPLAVECKLIEASSNKTTKLYCNHGIRRFVHGEYAWATREAFMIAYVRDDSTIKTSLTPFLLSVKNSGSDIYFTIDLPKPIGNSSFDLAKSCHGRFFQYPQGLSNNIPGNIALWHLWVST